MSAPASRPGAGRFRNRVRDAQLEANARRVLGAARALIERSPTFRVCQLAEPSRSLSGVVLIVRRLEAEGRWPYVRDPGVIDCGTVCRDPRSWVERAVRTMTIEDAPAGQGGGA